MPVSCQRAEKEEAIFQSTFKEINKNAVLFARWLSRLNMAAVGYAERERMRQDQGKAGWMGGGMERSGGSV